MHIFMYRVVSSTGAAGGPPPHHGGAVGLAVQAPVQGGDEVTHRVLPSLYIWNHNTTFTNSIILTMPADYWTV